MIPEDLLASVLEVALKQPVPESEQHRPVEREGPVEMGDDLGGGIQDSLVDCLGCRPVMVSARSVSCGAMSMAVKNQGRGVVLVPGIRVSNRKDDFGSGIRSYQL